MQELNLPRYNFRIRKSENHKLLIYDTLRHKELVLTPEEWVRQHIVRFLIEEKRYPSSLISLEAGLKVNRLNKRYDALVYSRKGIPVLLVECKAPDIVINQKTFDQIINYNQSIQAQYLMVTNGLKHYCCRLTPEGDAFEFLPEIPEFETL